ncbi:MAG TPA: class II fructose-bisphosphate aldolase [Gaiellaceae bacterium]|nr:class II fructose-bisphosphate aldolase [Gaiellaceae bacterium]HZT54547.1 class II fructose-bisphosphate aldolase [Gaiellaceae bacterium]
MRVRLSELLAEAERDRRAVGAFTCYNFEQAAGVLTAAADRRRGVVLLVSKQSFLAPAGPSLLAALAAVAESVVVPACVQLDHVDDLDAMRRAFELGAGAVMADGSRLPFEANVALVRDAVAIGDAFGGDVEAELGHVAGDEDVAAAVAAGSLTDPGEARQLVDRTGVTCLAVSIGNVHGSYRQRPRLDWPRLEALRAQVPTHLALHGASGLEPADVGRAIRLGVTKVNVNTELRERYLAVTSARLEAVSAGANVLALNRAQVDATADLVAAKLDELSAGD